MSSSSDEDVVLLLWLNRRRKRKRNFRVQAINNNNENVLHAYSAYDVSFQCEDRKLFTEKSGSIAVNGHSSPLPSFQCKSEDVEFTDKSPSIAEDVFQGTLLPWFQRKGAELTEKSKSIAENVLEGSLLRSVPFKDTELTNNCETVPENVVQDSLLPLIQCKTEIVDSMEKSQSVAENVSQGPSLTSFQCISKSTERTVKSDSVAENSPTLYSSVEQNSTVTTAAEEPKKSHLIAENELNFDSPFDFDSVHYKVMQDPQKFHSMYKMSVKSFKLLVEMIRPMIQKKDTNFRQAICAEERLLITLRYLATGSTLRSLSSEFTRGESIVGRIIPETCDAIWDRLQNEYMPAPSEKDWMDIAERFLQVWKMPNCIGALGGVHIRLNDTKYHSASQELVSLQLTACADADGNFIAIDTGNYSGINDGTVFKNSSLSQLISGKIPPPKPLPAQSDQTFPFYFIGNLAFPLFENLMKPFPLRGLTDEQRIFNYQLSKARSSVENAFDTLLAKFHVFHAPLSGKPDRVEKVVKSACVLQNFINYLEGQNSEPSQQEEDTSEYPLCKIKFPPLEPCNHRSAIVACNLRKTLCTYMNNPESKQMLNLNNVVPK